MEELLGTRSGLSAWKREVLRNSRGRKPRRDFLKALALSLTALAAPNKAADAGRSQRHNRGETGGPQDKPAFGESPKTVTTGTFFFPRLLFHVKDETGDQWNIYPVADVVLRKRLKALTNINASEEPVVVRLDDLDTICRYPFVFATSEGYFDLPKNEEVNLREFLMRGGFVYADDCVLGKTGDRFFKDYRKMIDKLFEKEQMAMQRVPNDHEIYRCYFQFPDGAPFLQGVNHGGYALFEKGTGRIMTYLTPGDLHCGWTCLWNTAESNEAALRMGINIVIYYLTH
jgi:hypothetical protein